MQWPPTSPGLNGKKFHFEPAASRTSKVSMSNELHIFESSLVKAIFMSLWVFSATFAASATLMLSALYVPASMIDLYNLSTISATSGVEPLVILHIFVRVFILSPGTILSGLYPQKKSSLNLRLELSSKMGTHTSSTQPGNTVDS